MTHDEQRQQKESLLYEHYEAVNELAHLSEKARRVIEKLKILIEFVEKARPGDQRPCVVDRERSPASRAVLLTKITSDPTFYGSLNFELLLGLVNELDEAKGKVAQLESQKRSLGLG